MHIHENYRIYPYQLPTYKSDQQQQIEEDLALMTQNRVYLYEYMDSSERFQEPQSPTKDFFYSSLTEEDNPRNKLPPCPNYLQQLRHDRPRRLSQPLSVNQCAFTGGNVREFQRRVPQKLWS